MFTKNKIGDIEIVEPTSINPDTKALLDELLAQNRMVLENNIRMIDVLSSPVFFVKNDDKDTDA